MTDYSNPEAREEKTLLEIIAFRIFKQNQEHVRANTTEGTPPSKLSDTEIWQNSAELRAAYRAVANAFIGDLNDAGVKVSIKKMQTAEQAVNVMQIIPARKAYNFAAE